MKKQVCFWISLEAHKLMKEKCYKIAAFIRECISEINKTGELPEFPVKGDTSYVFYCDPEEFKMFQEKCREAGFPPSAVLNAKIIEKMEKRSVKI